MKQASSAALGFGFAGLLLGAALTWSMLGKATSKRTAPLDARQQRLPSQEASTQGDRLAELSSAVQALGEEFKRLQPARPGSALDWPAPGEALATPSVEHEILMERLDRMDAVLIQLLELQASGAAQATSEAAPLPLLVNPERPANLAALESLSFQEEIDNDLKHLNWTYQEVLDTYGKPERSNPSPGGKGHKWYFELPGEREVIFWFVDGQVARVMTME